MMAKALKDKLDIYGASEAPGSNYSATVRDTGDKDWKNKTVVDEPTTLLGDY